MSLKTTVARRWIQGNSRNVVLYYDRLPGRVIVRLPVPQPIDPPEIEQILLAIYDVTKGQPEIGRWREEIRVSDIVISMSVRHLGGCTNDGFDRLVLAVEKLLESWPRRPAKSDLSEEFAE